MNKYIFTLLTTIAFLSIRAQNAAFLVRQNNDSALLSGEWKVTSATVYPLIIAQRCKPVLKGTILKFTGSELAVFTDTSGTPCDVYRFKIAAHTLNIFKEDVVWLCTYELHKNILKIQSGHLFKPYIPDTSQQATEQPVLTNNITITLIKKNN